MVSKNIHKFLFLLFLLLTIGKQQTYAQDQKQFPDGYMIIANDIDKKSISTKEVVQIFKGKYNLWTNNEQTVIVLPSSKHESVNIIANFLFNGSKEVMFKYWLSLVFQGRSNPPVFLENDASIIEYVSTTPGAIGIIKNNNSSLVNKYNIKIID